MKAAVRIPAELLYWGHLPATAGRLSHSAQRFRFERVLPRPSDAVHTTHARLPSGDVLIAGIEPERLRAHLASRPELTPDVWQVLPDRLPDHLAASGIAPACLDQLNFLHGPFEPAPRRQLRLLTTTVFVAGLALALIIALIGSERRAATLRAYADDMRLAGQRLLSHTVPAEAGSQARPELRLTMELRRLELALRSPAGASADVSPILERLLAQWPGTLRVQTETVAVTNDRVIVRGLVPTLTDAEQLAKACAILDTATSRFRAAPVQAQLGERGAAFLLTWSRQTDGKP